MNIGKKFLYSGELETKKENKLGKYAGLLPLLKILIGKEKKSQALEEKSFEERCENKTHFSKKDAETIRNISRKSRGVLLRVYHCQECNSWHLTHKNASRHNKEYKKK